jgi:hypothetical protein
MMIILHWRQHRVQPIPNPELGSGFGILGSGLGSACGPSEAPGGGRPREQLIKMAHRKLDRISSRHLAICLGLVVAMAIALAAMGHPAICTCGYVKLWHGVPLSSENSQHISDWYTFSHVIHGFAFYGLAWLVARRQPLGIRLAMALLLECGWEVFENTDFVINRYREVTISLDYYGDSVLNSACDVAAMVVGFFAAAWLPVWATVLLIVGFEAFVGYSIRDNLLLNIIMLIYPLDVIKRWQGNNS